MRSRARWRRAFGAAVLLTCPALHAESAVHIEVDGVAEGTPLVPVWAYFGYDEVNATTTPEGQELLQTLARAFEPKVHVRTHFLFNSGTVTDRHKWGSTNLYSENAEGAPVYDFSRIDAIMNAKVNAGVSSLFELGFMPQALSTHPEPYETSSTTTLDSGSFYPPTDYEKWAELVRTWAEHARDHHGQGAASADWLWELWNEPDIGYWRGTPEEYQRLYDYTEAALHQVLPRAALGGPAVAHADGAFLSEFLEHCANGQNESTGTSGTRLDFVTFHAKGGVERVNDHVQLDLGQQLALHRAGFEAVAASAFAELPIVISEADPDGCAACPSSVARHLDYRNSPAYGAYEVAMMKRSLDLAEETQVNLRGVLTWAFTFPNTPYFAGYRALATNGIHLPVLNAFKLLGQLRGRRLPVESSGAVDVTDGFRARADIDALAAQDGESLRVLVWNYHDELAPAEPLPVKLRVRVPETFGERLQLRHQRVDEAHGDAYVVWQAQGSPDSPSESQRDELRRAMSALELSPDSIVPVENGVATVTFELPRFGVSLVTLTAAALPEPTRLELSGGCAVLGGGARFGAPGILFLLAVLRAARKRSKG